MVQPLTPAHHPAELTSRTCKPQNTQVNDNNTTSTAGKTDEAHRCSGRLGRPWAVVHDNQKIPSLRRLYMTATPRLWQLDDEQEQPNVPGELVASMEGAPDGPFGNRGFTLEEGVTHEQIDGVIEIDGEQYIVEVKWWGKPVDIEPMSRQLVRIMSRAEARGLFISASGFTKPAVATCRDFLTQCIVMLGELREVALLLKREEDIANWVREKARQATIDRLPLALLGTDF